MLSPTPYERVCGKARIYSNIISQIKKNCKRFFEFFRKILCVKGNAPYLSLAFCGNTPKIHPLFKQYAHIVVSEIGIIAQKIRILRNVKKHLHNLVKYDKIYNW